MTTSLTGACCFITARRLSVLVGGGLLLIFTFFLQASQGASGGGEEYVPVRSVVYRSMAPPAAAMTTTSEAAGGGSGSGSSYEPFEVCEGCRCCAASDLDGSSCVDTSCCYAIDCNLPGKPFGTCAFTPHTCGCGGDANGNCTTTTQPAH